jgi:hypothetical protein
MKASRFKKLALHRGDDVLLSDGSKGRIIKYTSEVEIYISNGKRVTKKQIKEILEKRKKPEPSPLVAPEITYDEDANCYSETDPLTHTEEFLYVMPDSVVYEKAVEGKLTEGWEILKKLSANKLTGAIVKGTGLTNYRRFTELVFPRLKEGSIRTFAQFHEAIRLAGVETIKP